jgi:hypothetical protein
MSPADHVKKNASRQRPRTILSVGSELMIGAVRRPAPVSARINPRLGPSQVSRA